MIRARGWVRKDGGHTVRYWVPAGETHSIQVTGPCQVRGPCWTVGMVRVAAGWSTSFAPLPGPFSYTVRYDR